MGRRTLRLAYKYLMHSEKGHYSLEVRVTCPTGYFGLALYLRETLTTKDTKEHKGFKTPFLCDPL